MPGILARVPACHLQLGTPPPHPSLTPESRAGSIHPPHGTARVRASVPSPTPRHPLGSPLLHPLQNTTSKELGGTESFFHPFFYQELGADLLSKNPWKWKVEGHCEQEPNALLDTGESKPDPSCSTQGQF